MLRSELKTDLGRRMFDYSPIKKSYLSLNIMDDIASSYFVREEIIYYHRILLEDVWMYVAKATPSMLKYTNWRTSFLEHGYDAPILHLTGA